jgi:hypothetical protein
VRASSFLSCLIFLSIMAFCSTAYFSSMSIFDEPQPIFGDQNAYRLFSDKIEGDVTRV